MCGQVEAWLLCPFMNMKEMRDYPAKNDGCEYREQIAASGDGLTVLAYLADRFRHSSLDEWQANIVEGRVVYNGKPAVPATVLCRGGILVWHRPPWEEPDVPRTFSVVHDDGALLAVNKPAGLPTLPGANFLNNTLLNFVRTYNPDAAPLHRLGRWTSGLVLFAAGKGIRHNLLQQWSDRQVGKRYRALASGFPESDEMTITVPIGPVPHQLLGSVHAASPFGKPSSSKVSVLERREGAFLCDVRINTGRPHQIRIHMAAAGHPLVGDPLYSTGGVPLPDSCALPGSSGYHLHSAELSFLHPVTGMETVIECEPDNPLLQLSYKASSEKR